MNKVIATLSSLFRTPEVRSKIVYTAGVFLVFRIFAHIPVAGVDVANLRQLFTQNQFLGLLDVFSGGLLRLLTLIATVSG